MSKKDSNNNKKIEILWSGGWDSTFMLCKLMREYDEIQPYYILFNRDGEEYELKAIQNILNTISLHKEIQCNILPVIYIKSDNIKIPSWLYKCWEKYSKEPYEVSSQYLTFAAFAFKHKGIAVGQERYYEIPGHMTRLMYEKGHMKFTPDGVGYFNPKDCQKEVYALFGNAIYPISLYSELMMKEKIEEWGYKDIIKHIHFCYHPINGFPCGMCGPCRVKIKQHMDFLFKPENLKNGMVCNYIYKNNLKDKYGRPLWVVFEDYIRSFKSTLLETSFSKKISLDLSGNISNVSFDKLKILKDNYETFQYFESLLNNDKINCRYFK